MFLAQISGSLERTLDSERQPQRFGRNTREILRCFQHIAAKYLGKLLLRAELLRDFAVDCGSFFEKSRLLCEFLRVFELSLQNLVHKKAVGAHFHEFILVFMEENAGFFENIAIFFQIFAVFFEFQSSFAEIPRTDTESLADSCEIQCSQRLSSLFNNIRRYLVGTFLGIFEQSPRNFRKSVRIIAEKLFDATFLIVFEEKLAKVATASVFFSFLQRLLQRNLRSFGEGVQLFERNVFELGETCEIPGDF